MADLLGLLCRLHRSRFVTLDRSDGSLQDIYRSQSWRGLAISKPIDRLLRKSASVAELLDVDRHEHR